MITEGSCDTENWSNYNILNILKYKAVILNSFCCFFYQINVDIFQKTLQKSYQPHTFKQCAFINNTCICTVHLKISVLAISFNSLFFLSFS